MLLPLTPLRFLSRAAAEYGCKIGVVCGQERFTYLEFADRVRRLAGALRAGGIQAGDRVAVLSFNCHRLLEAYYGVPEAGAIVLPLNVRLAAEEQRAILNHSGARAVFFAPEFAPMLEQIRSGLKEVEWYVPLEPYPSGAPPGGWADSRTYDELLASAAPAPADYTKTDENAIAELFYTSGSTGRPKGVMLSHRTLYLHTLYLLAAAAVSDATVELHTIPLFHANGWGRPQTITFAGGRHIMARRFDPQWVLETIQRERVTAFSMVPTMATALVHTPGIGQYDLSSLQEVFLGGAPSSPALVRSVEQALGCRCYVGYGLTETSPVLTTARIKSTLGDLPEHERIQRQAMTGFAIPGVELRLVDSDGRDVPRDMAHIGEIWARSDVVMDGYWNEPDETRRALSDGWLRTGDMAVADQDGYFLIVDRKKDIIISGGENISSVEIERVLAEHPAVYECAVVGIPDEKWGEVPKAFVTVRPQASVTEDELKNFVRQRLAGFKVPKSIEFLDALPKGATGKILKRALRDPYWAGREKRVHG
jgi:fatty-acyl-CoA synthase